MRKRYSLYHGGLEGYYRNLSQFKKKKLPIKIFYEYR